MVSCISFHATPTLDDCAQGVALGLALRVDVIDVDGDSSIGFDELEIGEMRRMWSRWCVLTERYWLLCVDQL